MYIHGESAKGALTAGIEPVRQVRGFSLPEILTRTLSGWLVDADPLGRARAVDLGC